MSKVPLQPRALHTVGVTAHSELGGPFWCLPHTGGPYLFGVARGRLGVGVAHAPPLLLQLLDQVNELRVRWLGGVAYERGTPVWLPGGSWVRDILCLLLLLQLPDQVHKLRVRCQRARDTSSPRHTELITLTHCGYVYMEFFGTNTTKG